MHNNGEVTVLYDDGQKERLNMDAELWHFENETHNVSANSGTMVTAPVIDDKEPVVLQRMLAHFGNKTFLHHEAQGFEQFALVKAYMHEEDSFTKTVKIVPRDKLPNGANVVNSHVLYKIKKNDDVSLKLKARIAPHGNEDNIKNDLSTDCTTCPPSGLRIVESVASLHGWKVHKADVKSAFLQTGAAMRDVFVKPPRESGMRSTHMWLLLTAAYGLVNSNAKWQVQSDQSFFELGLTQCQKIPQLFYRRHNGNLVLIVAKIVDDIKAASADGNAKAFIENFSQKFDLGTVATGPGKMRFFGINTVQEDDMTTHTDADDKLNALTEYAISRSRRKHFDQPMNPLEKWLFASTNSSLGWIGTAASPLCSFYASYLQQKSPNTLVRHIAEQQSIVRKLKKIRDNYQASSSRRLCRI